MIHLVWDRRPSSDSECHRSQHQSRRPRRAEPELLAYKTAPDSPPQNSHTTLPNRESNFRSFSPVS